MQPKLSHHEKAILQILAEEIRDEFWGLPLTTVSWIVARKLEQKPGDYIENRKEWRKRRREEEVNRFRKGEIPRDIFEIEMYFLGDRRRQRNLRDEVLTEKWRATFSRSIRRLDARGLITRLSSVRSEEREGKWYYVRYVGARRCRRVVLTPQGREVCGLCR